MEFTYKMLKVKVICTHMTFRKLMVNIYHGNNVRAKGDGR